MSVFLRLVYYTCNVPSTHRFRQSDRQQPISQRADDILPQLHPPHRIFIHLARRSARSPPSPVMNSSSITSSAGPAYAASEVLGTCATPFYYSAAPSLMGGLSDPSLSLAAPIVAYWGLSLFFHFLDTVGWRWLERHRIHDSAEVAARNKASRADVLGAVIFQQVLQTAMGWWWIEDHAPVPLAAHCAHVATWAPPVARALAPALGAKAAWAGAEVGAYWIYWWAIPVLQFVWAM
jgi:hypothetical protein